MKKIASLIPMFLLIGLFFTLFASTHAVAAEPSVAASTVAAPSPVMLFVAENRSTFGGLKKIVLRASELMPEQSYSYTPAETTRTFGQIAAHIAESQYFMCSKVLGEQNPPQNYEKTRTTKAELIAALNESFAQCEKAFGSLTDSTATEQVRLMGARSRLSVLVTSTLHSIEHYGNMVTYMRMNGLVPPTSDPEFMKSLMKE